MKTSNATTTSAAATTQVPGRLDLSDGEVVPSDPGVEVQDVEGRMSCAPQFGQNLESAVTSVWQIGHFGNCYPGLSP